MAGNWGLTTCTSRQQHRLLPVAVLRLTKYSVGAFAVTRLQSFVRLPAMSCARSASRWSGRARCGGCLNAKPHVQVGCLGVARPSWGTLFVPETPLILQNVSAICLCPYSPLIFNCASVMQNTGCGDCPTSGGVWRRWGLVCHIRCGAQDAWNLPTGCMLEKFLQQDGVMTDVHACRHRRVCEGDTRSTGG
jgi:hypothetical protein